ncbi:MAG: ribosome-associated translation inhibitor RaiA [Patescibacteria group bacterium]
MQINLQGKGIELTEAIKDYVLKRVTNLEKLLVNLEKEKGEAMVNFEVVKTTNHHKAGEIFHASCILRIDGKKFFSENDHEDLYSAIDEVKENLFREISKNKDRRQTLFKRGASSIKKMLKGLSKRNPFTSKY